jgi:hypothetical protein
MRAQAPARFRRRRPGRGPAASTLLRSKTASRPTGASLRNLGRSGRDRSLHARRSKPAGPMLVPILAKPFTQKFLAQIGHSALILLNGPENEGFLSPERSTMDVQSSKLSCASVILHDKKAHMGFLLGSKSNRQSDRPLIEKFFIKSLSFFEAFTGNHTPCKC